MAKLTLETLKYMGATKDAGVALTGHGTHALVVTNNAGLNAVFKKFIGDHLLWDNECYIISAPDRYLQAIQDDYVNSTPKGTPLDEEIMQGFEDIISMTADFDRAFIVIK